MSGLQQEANKKHPLLGVTSKPKKKEKTYVFNLSIAESNEETYPEYSWKDLVTDAKTKKTNKDRVAAGKTALDPYASDDEDNLKALAASFEAKYANPQKKRKRRAEDYIDRGAGYDESDSFIDNSDAYDEVVPADLETVRGGFYINSGSLDFREVEISDDEGAGGGGGPSNTVESKENGKSQVNSSSTINSTTNHNIHSSSGSSNTKTNGKKVSLNFSKKNHHHHHHHHQTLSSKNSLSKSEKLKSSSNKFSGPVPSSNSTTTTTTNTSNIVKNTTTANDNDDDIPKKSPSNKSESSSSGSSSSDSSSSGDSSSSSDSSSDASEEEEDQKKAQTKQLKLQQQQQQQQVSITPTTMPASSSSLSSSLNINSNLNTSLGPPPIKRLKTKNVPPNPNLAKNKIILNSNNNNNNNNNVTSTTSSNNNIINNPTTNSGLTLTDMIVKDMLVSNLSTMPNTKLSSPSSRPNQSHSPSPLGINMPPGLTASNIKVPTPKSTPTGSSSNSSGINFKAMTLPKPKPKEMKQKLHKPPRNSMGSHSELKLLETLQLLESVAQSKKKPKLHPQGDKQGIKSLSSANLSRHLNQQPSRPPPPKLKAKPKPNPLHHHQQQQLPLSLSSTSLNLQNVSSSLNQSLPPTFSNSNRSSLSQPSQQQQSLSSSQRAEITKIKPGHLIPTSSPSSTAHNLSINSSIKSLSNLGTGITVTEVKEKGGSSSTSQHSSPSVTKEGPRSRSPNVGNAAMSHNSSRVLPQSITITPSSLLNLSTPGSSNSNLMSTPNSTSNSALNLSNMMNSMSNMARGNFFGQTNNNNNNNPLNISSSTGSNVKKSNSSGFSMNTILGTSHPTNSNSLFTDSGLMSTNKMSAFNLGRDSHKKTS